MQPQHIMPESSEGKWPVVSAAPLEQILWLDDTRSIDFLIDLLPLEDQDLRWRRLIRLRKLCCLPFRGMTLRMLSAHNESKGAGPWALSLLNHRLRPDAIFQRRAKTSFVSGTKTRPGFLRDDAGVNPQIHRSNAPGTLREPASNRSLRGESRAKCNYSMHQLQRFTDN